MSVPVRTESYAQFGHCTFNVQRKVQLCGGSAMNGRVIWYAPGDLIEAEYHTVWRSPTGELIDITPKADGEKTILFVPDPSSTWAGERLIDNVRRALSNRAGLMVRLAGPIRIDWEGSAPLRDAARRRIMAGTPAKTPRDRSLERRQKDKKRKERKKARR